jgi:glucose-6-phosphate isomerase
VTASTRRGDGRGQSGDHAVRHLFEDLYDAGNLSNASSAREWLVHELGEAAVSRHFVAVSTNHAAMDAFGIAPESRFTMWDWVGGRYSLWSAVGLSIALSLGMSLFELVLQGGHDMDEHFRTAPLDRNLTVLMGLIGVWNGNFLGYDSLAVLPFYDRRLHRFSRHSAARDGIERQERHAATAPGSWTRTTVSGEPATTHSTRSSSCCTRARRGSRWFIAP